MIPKRALQKVQSYKVHIRRLPPLLKEEEFYATIQEYLKDIPLKYYVKGKLKEQEKIDSRCYLFFSNEQTMNAFIQGYKKVFCDEKGQYYLPDIGKALFQNQQDLQRNKPNSLENQFEKTELFKKFLQAEQENLLQNQEITQEATETEEKPKRFEKVKTHIVMELEKEYLKKQELKTQIENMSNSNIIKLKVEENGKTVERTFIFVPKAKS